MLRAPSMVAPRPSRIGCGRPLAEPAPAPDFCCVLAINIFPLVLFCTLDVSKLVAACWQLSFGSCLSTHGPGLFGVPTSLCSMPVASAQPPRGRDKRNVEFSRRRSALESACHLF